MRMKDKRKYENGKTIFLFFFFIKSGFKAILSLAFCKHFATILQIAT